jgi:hypothetical protein
MEKDQMPSTSAWLVARKISELAFVLQKQIEEGTHESEYQDIENCFSEINVILNKHDVEIKKGLEPFFHNANVHRIADFIKDYFKGKLTEEDAKIGIWQTLVPPHPDDLTSENCRGADEPRYFDIDSALELSLPSREQVSVAGGPVMWARELWEDHEGVSKRTLANYKSKLEKGELKKPSLQRYLLLYKERPGFIESVLDQIIGLTVEESMILGKVLTDITNPKE